MDGKNNSSWSIIYQGFNPKEEKLRETLCTLGNGYMGTRGAHPESNFSQVHYPGVYIAGVYNKLPTSIASKTIINEDLVNCPNWLSTRLRVDNSDWIIPSKCKLLHFRQELNLYNGLLTRDIRLEDKQKRITGIKTKVFVSIREPHLAGLSYEITPENYSGKITVRSGLNGEIINAGVERYRALNSLHLTGVNNGQFAKDSVYLCVKTNHSGIKISQAARISVSAEEKEMPLQSKVIRTKKSIYLEYAFQAEKKRRYILEKTVSTFTTRDPEVRNPAAACIKLIKKSPALQNILGRHCRKWQELWDKYDIELSGDEFSQRVMRLHAFHLLQTASTNNVSIDAGLPARGLHGEAYRGHIFWDEMFVMFFYDLHEPKISRSLLLYRYRRIAQARKYARDNGYEGAMFPWQSGSTGEEETQHIHLNPLSGKWGPDYSRIQRHVSFAISYNVWQYWVRTHDTDFLNRYGAELMLSIAQFAASLAKYDYKDKRYHIDGIMGPDEFHEKLPHSSKAGLRDNAYTNVMLIWTLIKAKETLGIINRPVRDRLMRKIGINHRSLLLWEDIIRRINISMDDNGIINQFEGYSGLKELDWKRYRRKYGNIQRMDRILKAEGKSPDDYKVAKQADLLMLFYLFSMSENRDLFARCGYVLDEQTLRKNFEYYNKRTSHGSTLSKVVFSYLNHILERSADSQRWFREVLNSDLKDTQGGTTAEGIHAGVMGGSLYIALRAFAGIHIFKEKITVEPRLPKKWKDLRLKLLYRRNWITLSINKRFIIIEVSKRAHPRIPVEVMGKIHYLCAGKYQFSYS